MLSLLREKLLEVLQAVAPLIGVACVLQITLVQAPTALFLQFLAGSGLAIVGMLLLLAGIDYGILPMGRFIGGEIPTRGSLTLIIAVAFALASRRPSPNRTCSSLPARSRSPRSEPCPSSRWST